MLLLSVFHSSLAKRMSCFSRYIFNDSVIMIQILSFSLIKLDVVLDVHSFLNKTNWKSSHLISVDVSFSVTEE